LPVVQEPSFAAASWVVLSLLTHVSVVPREMVIGFGLNAVVERVLAPATMVTVVPLGVGLGLVVGLELPHAVHTQSPKATRIVRSVIARVPPNWRCRNPYAVPNRVFAPEFQSYI
jgi:hypothetical protein